MIYVCTITKNRFPDESEDYSLKMFLFSEKTGNINTPCLSFTFSLEQIHWQLRELKKYFKNDNDIFILCNDYEKLNVLLNNEVKYINALTLLS